MESLRERKKAKTRVLIQENALRLFISQGYDSTTVEQIAAASDVSASTFFRYFQTKEAVVLYDSLDPVIMAAFRAQPKNLTVIEALRRATKEVFMSLSTEKATLEQERSKLLRNVVELRGALLEEMVRNIDLLADMIGERLDRDPEDLAVRNLAGAIIGVGLAAMLRAYARPKGVGPIDAFDAALQSLSEGLLT